MLSVENLGASCGIVIGARFSPSRPNPKPFFFDDAGIVKSQPGKRIN